MKPNCHKGSGFNLIELLVVVAILGLLAALLLPAVSRAKHKAQKTVCISNQRQLGVALQSFLADNNAYPSMIGSTNTGNWWWASQLQSVVSGKSQRLKDFVTQGIWRCPVAPRMVPWTSGNEKELFCSYGYNAYGVEIGGKSSNALGLDGLPIHTPLPKVIGLPPVPESNVAVPADMMAIGDSIDGMVIFKRWLLEFSKFTDWSRTDFGRASDRHQGNVNVLFCDGHVESPTLKFVFEDKSDVALVRWNRDHQPHREVLIR